MRIVLLISSMAALAVAAPLSSQASISPLIHSFESHMNEPSSWSNLDFQPDEMLAVGTESTSSYAIPSKQGINFEADAMLAVGTTDTSSYAGQRRGLKPENTNWWKLLWETEAVKIGQGLRVRTWYIPLRSLNRLSFCTWGQQNLHMQLNSSRFCNLQSTLFHILGFSFASFNFISSL